MGTTPSSKINGHPPDAAGMLPSGVSQKQLKLLTPWGAVHWIPTAAGLLATTHCAGTCRMFEGGAGGGPCGMTGTETTGLWWAPDFAAMRAETRCPSVKPVNVQRIS